MLNKCNVLLTILQLVSVTIYAQNNFQFSPIRPKAGDLITFTYEPAGGIANTQSPIEALIHTIGSKGDIAEDIPLVKNGKLYTGVILTDTSAKLIYLSFSVSVNKAEKGIHDNNAGMGYTIQFFEGAQLKKGSNLALAKFYLMDNEPQFVKKNPEKALSCMKEEFALYSEQSPINEANYFQLLIDIDRENATASIQEKIDELLKQEPKKEEDFDLLAKLYQLIQMPDQAATIATAKKEQFPQGKWRTIEEATEMVNKFKDETEPQKKEMLLEEINKKIQTNKDWSNLLGATLDDIYIDLIFAYLDKGDWDGFKKAINKYALKEFSRAMLYRVAAWEMQDAGTSLSYAASFSKQAVDWFKAQWLQSNTLEKPANRSRKEWQTSMKTMYALSAITYGKVLYQMGDYNKGLPYVKEAALTIAKGKEKNYNTVYALLAEKVLTPKQLKKELEEFVKNDNATTDIKAILKRLYINELKTEKGFDNYMALLEKERIIRTMANLREKMLNEPMPDFALVDLNGNEVNSRNLKGKVLVIDFWATWCQPCLRSFPDMKKAVDKYKDSPDVKFLFISTKEKGENIEKRVSDLIARNNYPFHVLIDKDDKLYAGFKVNGLPTKFVIGRDGLIRFKSSGYEGVEENLPEKLEAMINMAKE